MSERPHFVADVMLGKLAKWLRLLGYDTLYFRDSDDRDLARIARTSKRILLTRDVELTKRRGVPFYLVRHEHIEEQLREVFKHLHLEITDTFSRCPECNHMLHVVEKETVREKIPPYVYQTHTRLSECPNCGRVYCRGSHWAHIIATLENSRAD